MDIKKECCFPVVRLYYGFAGHLDDTSVIKEDNNGFSIPYLKEDNMRKFDNYIVLSCEVITEFSMKGYNHVTIYAIEKH